MVMTTSKPASIHLTDMTREEAETVTGQIKENFDSLGNMLRAARDRKAYKALGYKTFDTYCKTEFGRSVSGAYLLIEDAKLLTQLEEKISENYGEQITLKIPASHLRPLKAVEDIDDKIKAIEYAHKLAEGEGKKTTKQHLEIAVFEVSGKRSEDFRSAIQKLGFTKGVQVEILSPLKSERGLVTNIDKLGKIYVEQYYGINKSKGYDATQLRILTNVEKPANPLEGSVASKGDQVLIYAEGLQGKKGTIYSWREGKTALVKIDGRENDSPIVIAYAEMELLRTHSENEDWETDLTWNTGNNKAYYFTPATDRITCSQWPTGLYIQPYHSKIGPIKTMEKWEENHALDLMKALATPANTKTLALTQAIELPPEQGKEFAADLITSLLQLFPDSSPQPVAQKALGISFSKTINELVSGKKTQTRRAWQDDYAKSFIRYFEEDIAIPALDKGRHRGGRELGFIKLTQHPYQQYLSQMSSADLQAEGGMVATTQEFINTFFKGQDKLVWVLHFEFLPTNNNETEGLVQENERLRQQVAEAETTIQSMVASFTPSPLASLHPAETSSPGESAPRSDFLVGNSPETASPGKTAQPDSWKQLLASNGFTPVPYELEGYYKGNWRGWKMFFHTPNGGVTAIDIASEKEEMFARCTEVDFDIDLGDEEALISWTRGIINQIEDFCPGQLSLSSENQSEPATTTETPKQDVNKAIAARRKKIEDELEQSTQELLQTNNKQKINKLRTDIRLLEARLQDVHNFVASRIGDSVIRRKFPEKKGTIERLDVSTTGLPTAWVIWPQEYEGEPNSPQEHNIGTLTNLSNASRGEK